MERTPVVEIPLRRGSFGQGWLLHQVEELVSSTHSSPARQLRELLEQDTRPWHGSADELPGQLNALLDRADPAPDGLTARMVSAAGAGDRARPVRSRDSAQWLDQPFFVYVAGDDHWAAREL